MGARGPIGRYRVVRLLGSGGMGEVFEAYDDRLCRPVAIKGLLRGQVSSDRRERLRREALSAAALSHPAITHVYEIVTEGDTDWVVMEYVEGPTLADVILSGPLAAGEVARIGIEVGEALADAHRHGIVHRDVKTENVLLTPSGHVKVLDFGLAKWTGTRAPTNDRLTTEGLVVGTSKAMSPEQALGLDVDARSDIFSLGSMLYELAVGKPAFRGATPVETMHKVAAAAFQPLAEACPDLPVELAAAIERCLAKERRDRHQSADALVADLRRVATSVTAATVAGPRLGTGGGPARQRTRWRWAAAGIAALTAAAVAALWFGLLAPRKPLTVAVLPVVTQTPSEDVRLASAAVADAIASHLAQLQDIAVIAGPEVRAVATGGKRPTEVARELGVKELVAGSLLQGGAGEPARVSLERLDGTTGRVLWSEQLEVGTDDLMLLEDRISTALDDAYRGIPTSGHPGARDATPGALRAYLEARSRLDSGTTSKGYVEEMELLRKAIAEAPRFLGPLTRLAGIHRYLYEMYRRPEDLSRCEALVARAVELAPDHPWVLRQEVDLALATGATDQALAVATQWTVARPGDGLAWSKLALALGRANRFRQAETAFRRSLALLPSASTFNDLAQLREARGDYAGARQAVREALGLSPGNMQSLGALAEIEMYAGNDAEAEKLYRDLLARRGQRLDRIHLGNCLYYQRRFAEAARCYRDAADADPTDYLAIANLADTELAMADPAGAHGHYAAALRLCDAEYGQGGRRRALLETRARCLAELGRGPEATMAIQEALERFPGNPSTEFMAALVAAVTGDTNACLAWTGKARTANAPAVWFAGPEFARIATDGRFAALLARR